MEELNVKAKLELEDESTPALEHIKKGFEGVHEKANDAAHEMLGFGRDALASFVGFNLGAPIEAVNSFTEEIFGASRASEDATRSLAGVLTLTGDAGDTFEQTTAMAAGLKDELENIAIAAGESADGVIMAYSAIAERSDKSRAQVEELTESMVYAGRAVSGGFAAISEGMQGIEVGAIRANNPIVSLIKQAGLAKGSGRQIAESLSEMALKGQIEQVTALAERAVTEMGEKMKAQKPTFTQLETSLKGIREQVMQVAGAPLIASLMPQFEHLKTWLATNQQLVTNDVGEVSGAIGDAIREGGELMSEGFQYLRDHGDEIKEDLREGAREIKEAFEVAKSVAEFIWEHREALAIAWGAKTVVPGVIGAAQSVAGGYGAVKGAITGAPATAEAATSWLASMGTKVVAGEAAEGTALATGFGATVVAATTLAAGLTAVAGVAATGYEAWGLYNDIVDEHKKDLAAETEAMNRATEQYGESEKATRDANEWLTQLVAQGDDAKAALLETAMAAKEASNSLRDIADLHQEKPQIGGEDAGYALSQILNESVKSQLADVGNKRNKDLKMDFSGSKFEIQQDFRDQDPDRVAIVFKQDIVKSATNRLQSNGFGIPFA